MRKLVRLLIKGGCLQLINSSLWTLMQLTLMKKLEGTRLELSLLLKETFK